jgi:hypothetical protein
MTCIHKKCCKKIANDSTREGGETTREGGEMKRVRKTTIGW